MRYHLIPVRMAVIKKQKTTKVGKVMEQLESLYNFSGNEKQKMSVTNAKGK